MIPFINAFLWRLSGSGKLGKWPRWVGYPLIVVCLFAWSIELWRVIILASACHATTRIPFTLVKDEMNIWNWLWLPVYSVLMVSPCLILGNLYGLKFAVPIFAFTALSNTKSFRSIIVWEACEVITGVAVMLALESSRT